MKNKTNNKSIADESKAKGKDTATGSNHLAGDDPVSENMSADEMVMFNQIMGEIEGPEKTESQSKGGAEPQKIENPDSTPSATAHQDDPHDGLDEDQQKAFESIMAQIESGDKSDNTKASGDDGDEPAQTEAEDDFAAELEKVAKEAEAVTLEKPTPQKKDNDDALDEDQQKALESIMAEIEGKSPKKAAAAADASKSPSTEAETKPVPQTKVDPAGDENRADADANDISDDIEDILKEITSDFEESNDALNEAKTDTDSLETDKGDDDIIVDSKPGETASEKRLPESVTTEEKRGASTTHSTAKDVSESNPAINQVATKAKKSQNKGSPLPEVSKSRDIAKKAGIIVSMLVILSLSLASYGYWTRHGESDPTPPSPVVQEPPVQREPVTVVEAPPPAPVINAISDQSGLKAIGDQIDGLRSELLAKRKEIEELRDYYQTGIDAEIRSMVETLQKTGSGRFTSKTAMADPVISLGMKAIQRRDAYIKKLQNPANALYLNSEELLFLSRKAGLLALMADKTSDIDVEGFIKQAHVIMAAHRHALAQLNIDDVEVSVADLESIWQRIDSQLSMKAGTGTPSSSATHTENEAIWAAVCSGNFSQKHKLTELSPEAAHCLATWKGKDLFLNEIAALSPAAARPLAAWEGDWLGLNGLTDLSPETAAYLAKWKGKGLSLNGLTRLSPRVVAILSEWQGDQIELINVKYMAHWENPKTRLFLSEEMSQKNSNKRQ